MIDYTLGRTFDHEFKDIFNEIPNEILLLDGIAVLDPSEHVKRYFTDEVGDISTEPNSNVCSKSPVGLRSEIFKPIERMRCYYLLWKYLKRRYSADDAHNIIKAIVEGVLYFGDATQPDVYYCSSFDFSHVLFEGIPFCKVKSSPPKKLESFMGQARQVIILLSEQFAGAIGCSNLLVNAAYFTKHYTDKQIRDEIQQTIHILNLHLRPTGDSAFTNVSLFDRPSFNRLFEQSFYPDGSKVVDNWNEVLRVQKIFAEFMAAGDPSNGLPYPFPVCSANLGVIDGKITDTEFFNYICDLNAERGIFNIHVGNRLALCCRLSLSPEQLKDEIRSDSFGNGGLNTGSSRISTINLHRIALMANGDMAKFNLLLHKYLDYTGKLLVVHRKDILSRRMRDGLLTFFKVGWCSEKRYFNSIGFVGLYDAFTALIKDNPYDTADYIEFAKNTIKSLENGAEILGKENQLSFNVEEAPAENMAGKLALKDKFYFKTSPDILSNQMIPTYVEVPFDERLDVASALINNVSGGAILHINIRDAMTIGANREMTRMLIEKYGITHFAFNRAFGICTSGHSCNGTLDLCPICGSKIDTIVSRIVGYYSNVRNWSGPRREEFKKRQFYSLGS